MAFSAGSDGSLLIGVSNGSVDIGYLGSTQSVNPGYYLRSKDGEFLPNPIPAPKAEFAGVFARGTNQYDACTYPDNQIVGVEAFNRMYSNTSMLCTSAQMGDKLTVVTPTGEQKTCVIKKSENLPD